MNDQMRILIAVVAVVLWLGAKAGPGLINFVRNTWAHLWPKVQNGTTVFTGLPLLIAAVMLGPMLMPAAGPVAPVAPVREPDLFDRCATSGRSLLADALDDIAGQKFDSVEAKEDAINQKILDIVDACFEPLNVQIAKAANANRLTNCADLIRKGEIRE